MITKFACEAIIRRQGNHGIELLLGRRGAGSDGSRRGAGQNALVGGHVEDDETSMQALMRELGEELGRKFARAIASRIQQSTVIVVEDLRIREGIRYIHCSYVLDADGIEEPVNTEPEDCAELMWVPLEAIVISLLFAPHRRIIECYLAGDRFGLTTTV